MSLLKDRRGVLVFTPPSWELWTSERRRFSDPLLELSHVPEPCETEPCSEASTDILTEVWTPERTLRVEANKRKIYLLTYQIF